MRLRLTLVCDVAQSSFVAAVVAAAAFLAAHKERRIALCLAAFVARLLLCATYATAGAMRLAPLRQPTKVGPLVLCAGARRLVLRLQLQCSASRRRQCDAGDAWAALFSWWWC